MPKTLEEARAKLLENNNTIQQLQGEIETLKKENKEKDTTIEDLRTLNQKYYLELAQGQAEDETEQKEEPKKVSLEDFAKTIKGVIK